MTLSLIGYWQFQICSARGCCSCSALRPEPTACCWWCTLNSAMGSQHAMILACGPLWSECARLRSAVRTSTAAYWSSWADTLSMIRARHPTVADDVVITLPANLGWSSFATFLDDTFARCRFRRPREGSGVAKIDPVGAGVRSQGGPLAGLPFTCCPVSPQSRFDAQFPGSSLAAPPTSFVRCKLPVWPSTRGCSTSSKLAEVEIDRSRTDGVCPVSSFTAFSCFPLSFRSVSVFVPLRWTPLRWTPLRWTPSGKKSAKFWASHPSAPPPFGPPPVFGAPLFLCLGLHLSGPHPLGPHPLWSKNSTFKNWPKSKLAEVEIGRTREKKSWPKSKLAEVDRARPLDSRGHHRAACAGVLSKRGGPWRVSRECA